MGLVGQIIDRGENINCDVNCDGKIILIVVCRIKTKCSSKLAMWCREFRRRTTEPTPAGHRTARERPPATPSTSASSVRHT